MTSYYPCQKIFPRSFFQNFLPKSLDKNIFWIKMALIPGWENLPPEILQQIALATDGNNLTNLCESNLIFQEKICSDPVFWRRFSNKWLESIVFDYSEEDYKNALYYQGQGGFGPPQIYRDFLLQDLYKKLNANNNPFASWLNRVIQTFKEPGFKLDFSIEPYEDRVFFKIHIPNYEQGLRKFPGLPFPVFGYVDKIAGGAIFIKFRANGGQKILVPEGTPAAFYGHGIIIPDGQILNELYQNKRISLRQLTFESLWNVRKPSRNMLLTLQKMADKGRSFSARFLIDKLSEYVEPVELEQEFNMFQNILTPIEIYTKICALIGVIGYLAFLYIPTELALIWLVKESSDVSLFAYYLDHLYPYDENNVNAKILNEYTLATHHQIRQRLETTSGYTYRLYSLDMLPSGPIILGTEYNGTICAGKNLEIVIQCLNQVPSFDWAEFAYFFPNQYRMGKKKFASVAQKYMAQQALGIVL